MQGDSRTYSYAVGLSSESSPAWRDVAYLARIIPRLCHSVNRICWVFGGPVEQPVNDVTPTLLTTNVIATIRQVDHVANKVLREANATAKLSQMPLVSMKPCKEVNSQLACLRRKYKLMNMGKLSTEN